MKKILILLVLSIVAALGNNTYTVQNGDTLWRIHEKLNVDLKKLMELNSIENPNEVVVGQRLIIPSRRLVTSGKQTPSANLQTTFKFNEVSEARGKIKIITRFGPPNFGEDPENDAKAPAYILMLDNPITIIAPPKDEMDQTTQASEIQLAAYGHFQKVNLAVTLKKVVLVRGKFFTAHTGHHVRKVLMDIESIDF